MWMWLGTSASGTSPVQLGSTQAWGLLHYVALCGYCTAVQVSGLKIMQEVQQTVQKCDHYVYHECS
jgi:hypothetical protein